MIGLIFDIIHFIVVFVPILIFLFPKVSFHKYILLLIALLPLHWVYFDDHCVFTKISKNYDGGSGS